MLAALLIIQLPVCQGSRQHKTQQSDAYMRDERLDRAMSVVEQEQECNDNWPHSKIRIIIKICVHAHFYFEIQKYGISTFAVNILSTFMSTTLS